MEDLHRELEILLDLLVAARNHKLVVVDLISLSVPRFKGKQSVEFLEKLLLDREVAVHVDKLHHVVDADLGGGHGSDIDSHDVGEHSIFDHVVITDWAVSIATLRKEGRKEVGSNFTALDFFKSLHLDGLKVLPESIVVAFQSPVMGCKSVAKKLREEDVDCLAVTNNACPDQLVQEWAKGQIFCLSGCIVVVRQLLRDKFSTDGGGDHDPTLDGDELLNQVHLALREKCRPLHQSLVNDLEDSVAHCAQFACKKGVCDNFAARLVRG